MRITSYFPAVMVTALFIGGCKTSSTAHNGSTTTTPSGITAPGEGSYFITFHQDIDSTGKITSSWTDTETVYLTGLPLFGKTNVMELLTKKGTSTYTYNGVEFLNYESNGDVTSDSSINSEGSASILMGWNGTDGPITYPFASQSPKTYTLDTIVNNNGKNDTSHLTLKFVGSGNGSTGINNQAVPTENVTMTATYTYNNSNNATETIVISFAPSLGVIVETKILQGSSVSEHNVVTGYVLKP